MSVKTWGVSALLFVSVPLWSQDRFEDRMHSIYRANYSQEVDDAEWANYVQKANQRSYFVGEGDTLWGLSSLFFGDGFFWSKIWSFNPSLTNPHLIRIGQEIRFSTGDIDQVPGIDVVGAMDPQQQALQGTDQGASQSGQSEEIPANVPKGFVPVEPAQVAEATAPEVQGVEGPLPKTQQSVAQKPQRMSGLYPGAPAIPPPRIVKRPVLKRLPPAFQESMGFDVKQFDDKGMSFDLRPPIYVNPQFVTSSFLYEGNAINYPRVGLVLETDQGGRVTGIGDRLFIKTNENVEVGDFLTMLARDYRLSRNGVNGDVLRYMGRIRVDGKVEGKDKVYDCSVVKSYGILKDFTMVLREPIPTIGDNYEGRPGMSKSVIVGGGADNTTRIFGQSDVVFLNSGKNVGMRVGDILGVYKRRDLRFRDPEVSRPPGTIGHLKVFHVGPKTASAFIIASDEVIVPGDEVGRPSVVAATTTKSEREDLDDIETGLDFNSDTSASESDSDSESDTEVR